MPPLRQKSPADIATVRAATLHPRRMGKAIIATPVLVADRILIRGEKYLLRLGTK